MSLCLDFNINKWFDADCSNYVRTLTDSQKKDFFNKLFTGFYSTNNIYLPKTEFSKGQIPTTSDIEFQYLLVDLCNNDTNGQYCRPYLLDHCLNYTRTDTENLIVKKICGCYLPESQYDNSVGRACDFICSSYDTIRYYEENSNYPLTCISNVCVIDSVTIQVIDSSIGNITFNQLCPYCSGSANCKCIINDINIITQNSKLGSIDINQQCSPEDSKCYETNLDNIRHEVSCDTYFGELGTNPTIIEQQRIIYTRFAWITGVLSIILLILFIICFIFLYRINPQIYKYNIYTYAQKNEAGGYDIISYDPSKSNIIKENISDKVFF